MTKEQIAYRMLERKRALMARDRITLNKERGAVNAIISVIRHVNSRPWSFAFHKEDPRPLEIRRDAQSEKARRLATAQAVNAAQMRSLYRGRICE